MGLTYIGVKVRSQVGIKGCQVSIRSEVKEVEDAVSKSGVPFTHKSRMEGVEVPIVDKKLK
jgi:hypothetical protein